MRSIREGAGGWAKEINRGKCNVVVGSLLGPVGIFFNRFRSQARKVEKKHGNCQENRPRWRWTDDGDGSWGLIFQWRELFFTNISSSFPALDLAGAGFDVYLSHKTKFVSMVQLRHRVSGHRPPKGCKRSKGYFYRPRAEGLSQWVQRFSYERTDELLETIFWLRFGNYRAISCISQGWSNYTVWSEWVWKE